MANRLTRRAFVSTPAAAPLAGWLGRLAAGAAEQQEAKSCILLWMAGGPSQTDTFDLKPGHANGGPFKEIATAAARPRTSPEQAISR